MEPNPDSATLVRGRSLRDAITIDGPEGAAQPAFISPDSVVRRRPFFYFPPGQNRQV